MIDRDYSTIVKSSISIKMTSLVKFSLPNKTIHKVSSLEFVTCEK